MFKWLLCLSLVYGVPVANFVLLLADDLGWADISAPPFPDHAMWTTKTPRLEQMAQEGVTLLGYRNAASLCTP